MKYTLTEHDIYKTYKASLDKPRPQREHATILKEICEVAMEDFILKGHKVYIPFLGNFGIFKYKPKKPKVDYYLSKKYKKTIRFTNRHTGGYATKLVWDKNVDRCLRIWGFNLTRSNRRLKVAPSLKRDGVYQFTEFMR